MTFDSLPFVVQVAKDSKLEEIETFFFQFCTADFFHIYVYLLIVSSFIPKAILA